MTPDEVEKYQQKLIERKRASRSVHSILDAQKTMPAGSAQRDATMSGVGSGLDRLGGLTQELIKAGVIDGYGALTERARRAGMKLPD